MFVYCLFVYFLMLFSINHAKPLKKLYAILPGSDRSLYNKGFHEGDIFLVSNSTEVSSILSRNAVVDSKLLWPHAAVVYKTEDNVGCPESPQCKLLMDAMNEYHEKSCIRFKQWTGEENYVSIFFNPDSGSCWSPVGMVGDKQRLSLGQRCWYFGIVVHELGHAIGFWHEMNRPDRDEHIIIDWQNIISGFVPAFRKMRSSQVNLLNETFDTKSVMMYDEYAFSKDGVSPTIQTIDGGRIGPLWKKHRLSDSDIRRLQKLYKCEDTNQKVSLPYNVHWTFTDNDGGFQNGEFTIWKWKTDEENSYIISTLNNDVKMPGTLISPNMYPVSKEDKLRGPDGCIRFWSVLEGDGTMISLDFEMLDNVTQLSFNKNKTKTIWFSKDVNQLWTYHQITIDVTHPFRVTFLSQYYSKNKIEGIVAIDDVEILYDGPCHDIKKSIPKKPSKLLKDSAATKLSEDLQNVIVVNN